MVVQWNKQYFKAYYLDDKFNGNIYHVSIHCMLICMISVGQIIYFIYPSVNYLLFRGKILLQHFMQIIIILNVYSSLLDDYCHQTMEIYSTYCISLLIVGSHVQYVADFNFDNRFQQMTEFWQRFKNLLGV